jgi:predicted dehydrogenase
MNNRPNPSDHATSPSTAPSRRQFLGAAMGTVAAAAAIAGAGKAKASFRVGDAGPAVKAAKRAALASGGQIQLGVVGVSGPGMCGMGTAHCAMFTRLAKAGADNHRIAAVCDVNTLNIENALAKIAAEGDSAKVDTYTDYRKMLAREDLHGVILAVPEHWHAQMAIDAVAAGKDVYLEKPMTLTLDEALKLRRVMHDNPDIRLQVGTQATNLPKFHEAKKLVKAGAIGVPVSSQVSYCRNSKHGEWTSYAIGPDWKPGAQWIPGENLDWDMWCGPLGKHEWDPKIYSRWRRYRGWSNGLVSDLLVHVITPMLVSIGDEVGWPTRVVANGSHMVDKDMENHDTVQITAEFESGHQMFILGSTSNETGVETVIRGNKANIYLGGKNCVLRPERIWADEVDDQTVECADIINDQDLHRLKWLKCIRDRDLPDSDVEQGSKVMAIVDLAVKSMWENAAFGFDPKTMTVTKF